MELIQLERKKIILTELDTIPVFLTSSMGIIKTNNRYYVIKRNNQKEKEGYLHIIIDAAALEKVPQIFNRFSTSVTMGKDSAETKSSLSNKHIEFTQQEKAIHNNHKKRIYNYLKQHCKCLQLTGRKYLSRVLFIKKQWKLYLVN